MCATFLLPPVIKGLKTFSETKIRNYYPKFTLACKNIGETENMEHSGKYMRK